MEKPRKWNQLKDNLPYEAISNEFYDAEDMDAFLYGCSSLLFCARDVGRRCQTIDVGCDCPNCKVMRALRGVKRE